MSNREVVREVKGHQTEDGAGVKLTRVIAGRDVRDFDPFLMLDAFDSRNPADYTAGFPWHPHRGIETVTYLIRGDIEHWDSLGNRGRITDGACQWMTAGHGIIHQEMPQPSEHMLGAQLWVNLPRKDKLTRPAYHDIQPHAVIKVREEGANIAVIAGEYGGKQAPTQGDYVRVTYLDVELEPGRAWGFGAPPENTVFIYLVSGSVVAGGREYPQKQALLFGPGDRLELSAGTAGARFLLFSGRPLHEPVAWGGPIVMNTKEELEQAFRELEDGTFAKDCDKAHRDYYQ